MRVRRWLVVAVFLSIVAAACGSNTAPSTAPGGASSAPSGSQSPVDAVAARLGDPAAAQQVAAEVRAQIREQLGVAEILGADAQGMLDALDALEIKLMNTSLGNAPGELAGTTATARLASYVPPTDGHRVASANPMITALVGLFLEPMIETAMDQGKGSFSKTSTEAEPGGNGAIKEKGTFTWKVTYANGLLQGGFEGTFSDSKGEAPNKTIVSETFSMSYTITPCPDSSGKVVLDITYEDDTLAAGPTQNEHFGAKVTLKAVMNVDDNAELVGTDVSSHIEGKSAKTTSAGESTEGAATVDMAFGMSQGGAMGDINVTSGSYDGDGTRARESQTVGLLTSTFLSMSVASAAKAARSGWRNGKCVELADLTPESKEVTAKEKVDIAATLKHRVTDEELKKKVKATVTGKGTVEPAEADGPKVTYVYTAGENPGDSGAVELKSVSNRGIATKTLTFTIRGKWTLAAHGTFTQMLGASVGGMTFGADLQVTVDPFPLNVDDAGQITGTGTIHFNGHPVFPPGTPCTGTYVSTETLNVTGTQGTDANGISLLTLHFSAPPGTVNSTIDCPGGIGGSTQFNMAGGFGGNLTSTLQNLPGVAIPGAGGSVKIDQEGTSAVWNTHAVLTFELTVAQ